MQYLQIAPSEGRHLNIKVFAILAYFGLCRLNELVKLEWNDVAVFENKVEFKIMRSKRTGPMQYDTKLIDDNLAVGILKYYMSLFAETVSYYIKYIYKLNSMFNRIRRVVFCALLILEKRFWQIDWREYL